MTSSSDYPDRDDRPEEFLRYLLRHTGGQVTAEVVAAAPDRFGIPRLTLFRLAARFRKTQRTSSLGPRKRGTQEGAVRLNPRTERVIAEQVDGFWLKKEKPSFAALLRRIREVCLTEGLSPPHRSTVQCEVSELIPMSAAGKRGEREIEAASTPSPGQFNVARPNALWQIDHTVIDVIVVDEQFRRPIGRPVMTIAIDVCTRMVAGFHLSLEAPSSMSVGLRLLHAVYDKTAWLDEREIDIPWPVAGLPEVLYYDNGADFRSRALFDACKEYGMNLQFRPPATPRFGGHIERLIGTMMGAVHLLPGTTFSNVKIRGGYDSEGRAKLTLRELKNGSPWKSKASTISASTHHCCALPLRYGADGKVKSTSICHLIEWHSGPAFCLATGGACLKTVFNWRISGTGPTPYRAKSVAAPNSRSNMIHEIFPEYSFANPMVGLLKHGTGAPTRQNQRILPRLRRHRCSQTMDTLCPRALVHHLLDITVTDPVA